MDSEKQKSQNSDEFGQRRISQLFSSLRPKKKSQGSTSKSNESGSTLSTLLLANYDNHLYLNPYDTLQVLPNEKKKTSNSAANKKNPLHIPEITIIESVECETDESGSYDDTGYNTCDVSSRISVSLRHVDKFKNEIYEDMMNLLSLDEDDLKVITSDEDESIAFSKKSAIIYVKDVFGESQDNKDSIDSACCVESNVGENFCLISSKTNAVDNIEAHCALLQILLKYELRVSKTPHYHWSEEFSFMARSIMKIHIDFRFIEEPYISHAKWAAYTELHQHHPLKLEIFQKLLETLLCECKGASKVKKFQINFPKPLKIRHGSKVSQAVSFISLGFAQGIKKGLNGLNSPGSVHPKAKNEDVIKIFWESSYKLVDSFLEFIHKLHINKNEDSTDILTKIFELLQRFEKIFMPCDIPERNFEESVKESLTFGTIEHFTKNVNQKLLDQTENDTATVEELIKVVKFTHDHMKEFVEKFGEVFNTFFGINLAKHLYSTYDTQLKNIIKPTILKIGCKSKANINKSDNDTAKKAFELNRELDKFLNIGLELYERSELKLKDHAKWLIAGFDRWHKIQMFNATDRIEKSIEKDSLLPDHVGVKFSTSAIDTMQILYGIKKYWDDLGWLMTNENDLTKPICLDVCDIVVLYFQKYIEKFERCVENKVIEVSMKVPLQLTVAIANCTYVSNKLEAFIEDFIKDKNTDLIAIRTHVENTKKVLIEKSHELLRFIIQKLQSKIKQNLIKIAQNNDSNGSDTLAKDIEDILSTLHKDLPINEFEIIKSILWKDILENLMEVVQKSISEKKSQEFFKNLQKVFTILKEIFKCMKISTNGKISEKINRIDYLIGCFSQETSQIIHQYYKDRYELQQQNKIESCGSLAISCYFIDNQIKLQILNARNLVPIGPNKKFNTFVKIQIIPDEFFPNSHNIKTKVQQYTDYALFDETFELPLTTEQRKMKDVLIHFKIKDKYVLSNAYLAEAFLSINDIPELVEKDKVQQIHLKLSKTQNDDLKSLEAIKLRSEVGDKKAKEFLSKLTKLSKV